MKILGKKCRASQIYCKKMSDKKEIGVICQHIVVDVCDLGNDFLAPKIDLDRCKTCPHEEEAYPRIKKTQTIGGMI